MGSTLRKPTYITCSLQKTKLSQTYTDDLRYFSANCGRKKWVPGVNIRNRKFPIRAEVPNTYADKYNIARARSGVDTY